jgi:uncharacterized protein YijF (DUF1287 family)
VFDMKNKRAIALLLALLPPLAAFALGDLKPNPDAERLAAAAIEQTRSHVTYDSSYRKIAYPGGDVPEALGVCADVVIRAYRKLGIDLQVRVHEDMLRNFRLYPQLWKLSGPDTNIDHRRVPNLQTYFRRAGAELPVSQNPEDYLAGDLVTWSVPPHLPHIGIVTGQKSPSGIPLIVHNIGRGPQLEDMLFMYPITGHYRYHPRPP